MMHRLNENNIPKQLHRYISIVSKCGIITSDSERYEHADKILDNPTLYNELRSMLNAWTEEDQDIYEEWADRESLTTCDELAYYYFTFMLADEIGISTQTIEYDTLDILLKDLSKYGSYKRASNRMHAAKFLGFKGQEAEEALSILEKMLLDEDYRVRVWVNFAIATITGEYAKYKHTIQRLAEDKGDEDEGWVRLEAEAALEELDRRSKCK